MILLIVAGYSRTQVNVCGGEEIFLSPDYVIPATYERVLNVCPCVGSAQQTKTYFS
jgi:hypothetical protein